MTLNATLAPSGNFNLSNWKITLPVDATGGITGTAVEVQNLTGYQNAKYFYTATDGAMVFRAMVEGATTSGSSYARSELREMIGTTRAAWNLSTGGVMTATLEVDQAPIRSDGTVGKLVVGQIHGVSNELVRLYWDNSKLYFANDISGSAGNENKFYFANAAGAQPNVSLDERFSYVIDAKGTSLEVTIYADGDIYKSVTTINSAWQSDSLYFKAGTYLGVNETGGTGWGQTSFYDVRFNHTDTALTPPAIAPATTTPPPVTTPIDTVVEVAGKTITGTDSANTINGTAGADLIDAKMGNDTVYGLDGSDTIYGGTGTDLLFGGSGADILYGDDGWDTLTGGAGADRLFGGAGGDKFQFAALSDSHAGAIDMIMDFASSQGDRILLSAIDANMATSGDQAFKFIGTTAFSHVAGQLHYYQANGDTFIEGDVNGDGLGDFLIGIHATVTLTSSDFVL